MCLECAVWVKCRSKKKVRYPGSSSIAGGAGTQPRWTPFLSKGAVQLMRSGAAHLGLGMTSSGTGVQMDSADFCSLKRPSNAAANCSMSKAHTAEPGMLRTQADRRGGGKKNICVEPFHAPIMRLGATIRGQTPKQKTTNWIWAFDIFTVSA